MLVIKCVNGNVILPMPSCKLHYIQLKGTRLQEISLSIITEQE